MFLSLNLKYSQGIVPLLFNCTFKCFCLIDKTCGAGRLLRHTAYKDLDPLIVALIIHSICIFLFNTRPHKLVSFEFSS